MTGQVKRHMGNYRLVSLLGTGTFADVYLGEHIYLNTQVALKVLRAQLEDPHAPESFLTEARLLSHLVHPHIIRVLEFGLEDQIPYLVMDYAPWGNVRQLFPPGTMVPLRTVASYVTTIASALQYAHDQYLIHRDLKPENLLVGAKHEILLSDFGLALLAPNKEAIQVQGRFGTIAYMAPEQINGQPSPASDQYALAVIVYEWLCGKRPFSGTASELSNQHLFAGPPSLCEQRPEIPPGVEQVVHKALSKDATRRYVDILSFASAFEEASHAGTLSSNLSNSAAPVPLEAGEAQTAQMNPHISFENLPVPLTPLVGRVSDLQEVRIRLLRPQVRLLTLTGMMGVGKTRLALALGSKLREEFASGVCFVSLASISDPDLVIPTIIRTFDLPESRQSSPCKHLVSYLHDKQLLLLLDNFEHLLPAASLLPELLAACSQLKILVTSRVSLHVQGEYEFEVLPLAIPDLRSPPAYETLLRMAAVELFVQRVEALKPNFRLTEENAAIIAEICVRLEGLPLAIEMAAARSKLLSLKALLSRLDESLEVLSSGRQDAPSHQQTLRTMIAWSYELLSAEQQMLFRRLCVFVRDFTLEAAEAVISTLGGRDVLDGIAGLIDCSLLRSGEEEGQEPRLHFLETVRAYGLEQLATSGELERCREAHAAYYLALTEDEAALDSATQVARLELLEREYENIRAAMQWLRERHKAEAALQLAASLCLFWYFRGYLNEGRRFLEQALEISEGDDTENVSRARAKALFALGFLSFFLQDRESAAVLLQESLALFRRWEDKRGIADSLRWLGTLIHNNGEVEKGIAMLEESLALSREIGEDRGCAESLLVLGVAALFHGKYDQANELFEESLTLQKAIGNPWRTACSLHYLAMTQIGIGGDIAHAYSLSEESLALLQMFRTSYFKVEALTVCALEATARGEETRARALLEEASVLAHETESTEDLARVLWGFGHLALRQGNLAEAREMYINCVKRMQGRWLIPRLKWVVASCLEGLGEIALAQGQPTWAVQLLGAAEGVRAAHGYYSPFCIEQPFYDHTLAAARNKLSEKNFAIAWKAGMTMTPEQMLNAEAQSPSREKIFSLSPTMLKSAPILTASNEELTTREIEVLTLVATGMSNRQIAERLVLSPNTVNTHIQSIYQKLNISSRSAATRFAMEHHLV